MYIYCSALANEMKFKNKTMLLFFLFNLYLNHFYTEFSGRLVYMPSPKPKFFEKFKKKLPLGCEICSNVLFWFKKKTCLKIRPNPSLSFLALQAGGRRGSRGGSGGWGAAGAVGGDGAAEPRLCRALLGARGRPRSLFRPLFTPYQAVPRTGV